MMTSPIKLNVVYSRAPFGSESKPEERGTSDEGASDEVRADLLDTRTVQVINIADKLHFPTPSELPNEPSPSGEGNCNVSSIYSREDLFNRLVLRLIVQPKRSDSSSRPTPQAAWVSTSRTV